MQAARVPLVGIVIAVAVLCLENVGVLAYREHVQAAVESTAAAKERAEYRALLRAIEKACDEGRMSHCRRGHGARNIDRPFAYGPPFDTSERQRQIEALQRAIEVKRREIEILRARIEEQEHRYRCGQSRAFRNLDLELH